MATTLLPMSCFLARWGRSSWLWGSSVETWKATWNNLFQGEVYSQNLATIYIILEPWLPYSSLRWCGCPFVLSLCQDHPQNLGSPWEPLKANWRLNEHDMQFHSECIGVPVTGQENWGRHQGFCLDRCFQAIVVLWPDYVIEIMKYWSYFCQKLTPFHVITFQFKLCKPGLAFAVLLQLCTLLTAWEVIIFDI